MAKKRLVLRGKGNIVRGLFTKYGLDTNVLVDLILYPKAVDYFKKRGFIS